MGGRSRRGRDPSVEKGWRLVEGGGGVSGRRSSRGLFRGEKGWWNRRKKKKGDHPIPKRLSVSKRR